MAALLLVFAAGTESGGTALCESGGALADSVDRATAAGLALWHLWRTVTMRLRLQVICLCHARFARSADE